MIFHDIAIRKLVGSYATIGPSSQDVHLGDELIRLPYGVTLDPEQDQSALWQAVPLRDDGRWMLGQGTLYLGVTAESISAPADAVAFLHGISSLGRLGLLVHATAGLIDAGNTLRPTLELFSPCGRAYRRNTSAAGRLVALLADGRQHSRDELYVSLRVSNQQLRTSIRRARAYGWDIRLVESGYRLEGVS